MKPIFLNEEEKKRLAEEILAKLAKSKMFDGKLDFTYKYEYEKNKFKKAKLWYTPEAWAKMTGLVDSFEGEVGWHGVIERLTDNEWMVSDIIVYPQTVTAAHVDTDEKEFHDWWMEQQEAYADQEVSLNFQGHSHVNMSVSPSATDLEDQQTKMADMKHHGFYVFTIQNKKREHKTWIYDYDNNVAYMPNDIDVDVMIYSNETLEGFLEEAHDLVTTAKYTVNTGKTTTGVPSKKEDAYGSVAGKLYGDYYPYMYNPDNYYNYYD